MKKQLYTILIASLCTISFVRTSQSFDDDAFDFEIWNHHLAVTFHKTQDKLLTALNYSPSVKQQIMMHALPKEMVKTAEEGRNFLIEDCKKTIKTLAAQERQYYHDINVKEWAAREEDSKNFQRNPDKDHLFVHLQKDLFKNQTKLNKVNENINRLYSWNLRVLWLRFFNPDNYKNALITAYQKLESLETSRKKMLYDHLMKKYTIETKDFKNYQTIINPKLDQGLIDEKYADEDNLKRFVRNYMPQRYDRILFFEYHEQQKTN